MFLLYIVLPISSDATAGSGAKDPLQPGAIFAESRLGLNIKGWTLVDIGRLLKIRLRGSVEKTIFAAYQNL